VVEPRLLGSDLDLLVGDEVDTVLDGDTDLRGDLGADPLVGLDRCDEGARQAGQHDRTDQRHADASGVRRRRDRAFGR
jgi:hypothetical protein